MNLVYRVLDQIFTEGKTKLNFGHFFLRNFFVSVYLTSSSIFVGEKKEKIKWLAENKR